MTYLKDESRSSLDPSFFIRKIIHVDMDAFYASVEQRDNPALRGKPVIVGGSPYSRGVVAAASYEARRYGIHSAMPSSQAHRLCPFAVFVSPDFSKYHAVSDRIMAIFREYTDLVEALSLDEAFLDVTVNKKGFRYATEAAQDIRRRIFEETRLTASAGVAPNKFLAKVGSDMNKPNGLTVIPPEKVSEVLARLPIGKVPGVGRVTEAKMKELGIHTIQDLQSKTELELVSLFGKSGSWYFQIARGIDDREVEPEHQRKSVGAEETFERDLTKISELEEQLSSLAECVAGRLEGDSGRTVTLKVTYDNFDKITRSKTLLEPVGAPEELLTIACDLLRSTEAGTRPIRLLGISVSNLSEAAAAQGPVQLLFAFMRGLLRRSSPDRR